MTAPLSELCRSDYALVLTSLHEVAKSPLSTDFGERATAAPHADLGDHRVYDREQRERQDQSAHRPRDENLRIAERHLQRLAQRLLEHRPEHERKHERCRRIAVEPHDEADRAEDDRHADVEQAVLDAEYADQRDADDDGNK